MENTSPTVVIPATEYFCNVAVFPAPATISDVPKFYLLDNVADTPKYHIGNVEVKYYPGSVYCFLPSTEKNQGSVSVYKSKPSFLDSFTYCFEIDARSVNFLGNDSNKASFPDSSKEALLGNFQKCAGCFSSHYPSPNTFSCKWNKKFRRNVSSVRLRGGAGTDRIKMIGRAVENARVHGIKIHPGVENLANGNCAFEAIIDSINTRSSFEERLDQTPDYWRKIWMTEVERVAYNDWNNGMTKEEWKTGFELLKQPRMYEHQLGDLVLPGVAHCLQKDIVVFNTSPNAHSPVYVIEASKLCGQQANNEIPICLAYDQTHYEPLIPDSDEDIIKTIRLKTSFIEGTYKKTMADLPFFRHDTSDDQDASKAKMGPPPSKKTKKLTPAERKRKSREAKSAENKREEQRKDRQRKVENRKKQTEEKRQAELFKDRQRKEAKKKTQTQEETQRQSLWNKQRKAEKKKTQTEKERQAEILKNKQRKESKKKMQTLEERQKELDKDRKRKAGKHTTVDYKEALNSQDILEGSYSVPDIKDTFDNIGEMNVVCQYCYALKFQNEPPSTCCLNGKVILERFPNPPAEIDKLFKANTDEGKLFREHSRSLNNAVCLTSIMVKHRHFQHGFNPSIIFEGRVQQLAGSLQAAEGEKPCFAQLYVHDASMETGERFKNMTLPQNISNIKKQKLESHLKIVQDAIHRVNPFVKDFKQIVDIPEEELGHGKIIISAKARPSGEHARRYNAQINLNEVSILTNSEPHDLVLQRRGGALQKISDLNPKGMPLHFTLLFPHGTYGWDLTVKHTDGKRRVTTREFYVFHLNVRDIQEDFIHLAGRLFQEWICLAWVAVENQKLLFQRKNQKALRADSYINIREATELLRNELTPRSDGMYRDDHQRPPIGRKILSSSYSGSPRWYNAKFQDGMAICREYHKPDFFITMTCNPHWPEIQEQLKEGQTAQDRPDIVARVFRLKKDQLLQDIKGGVLGKVVAHMHVVEFQKRGLPHAHFLIILSDQDRNITPEFVDSVVVAEIPPEPKDTDNPAEKSERERLRNIVMKNMIHGPCGAVNPNSPCMENGRCTKNYPKDFVKQTIVDPDNNYATYRRRSPEDGGLQVVCPKTKQIIDNRSIVPYCPFLSKRFNCHINFEFCTSPKASKYLYKYVTKGSDRAMVETVLEESNGQPRDEISEYEDLRSVGSSEATWHLMAFPITERYPPVMALRVHTENQHQVVFDEGTEEEALEKQRETELTSFFQLNAELRESSDVDIMSLPKYVDLPKKFRYDKSAKRWIARKTHSEDKVIGRVHTVNPLAGETFYLRMLLHNDHCKGKRSFSDMKILDTGRECETFQEVCRELGLLNDDLEWRRVLEESAATQLCPQIREVFIIILMFCQPASPRALFDEFWMTWTDDFEKRGRQMFVTLDENQLHTMLLLDLETRLQSFEKSLGEFGLPMPTPEDLARVTSIANIDPVVIREEKDYCLPEMIDNVQRFESMFTPEQSLIYETVMRSVKEEKPLCVFIDARGGCGKTFLLNAILSAVRSLEPGGCVALATATTGIAANLLELGRTYHSRFKAPLTATDESMLQISAQSTLAKLVRMAKVILIDEATMLHRLQLETLDRSLKDLMQNFEEPFGGKVILLAGDFRQCLPVVPGTNRAGTVSTCINKSRLWHHFEVLRLTENMRVRASGDQILEKFDEWTLEIGNGINTSGSILIPKEMLTEIVANSKKDSKSEEKCMKKFCQEVFPEIQSNIEAPGWLEGRTILAPTNREVDSLNSVMEDFLPTASSKLLSADTLENPEDAFRFNSEYLNTLKPNGFPHHILSLKPGMPIMLLRNINPRQGLCNGTRLIFDRCIDKKLLQCRIVGSNRVVLIPRITFIPKANEYPFEWQRRQFPVRSAFAITINKSQGQTLKFAGVWLRCQVFTHGQLYVACSRVSAPSNLKFAIMEEQKGVAENIVFKEVLSKPV